MRAVLHVPANRIRVFQAVRALLEDESVDLAGLAVVAHGGGIDLLLVESRYSGRVETLVDLDVDVAACRRSMGRQDVDPGDLVEGVRTVPSGVGELVRLQDEGYVYLRA